MKGFLRVESAVTPLRVNGHKGRGGDDDPMISVEFDHVVFASFPEIEAERIHGQIHRRKRISSGISLDSAPESS